MVGISTIILLLLGETLPNPGFLTVHSQPPGLSVFIDDEPAGITPVDRYQLSGGKYWVTIVPNDSLETLYRQLRQGSIARRLAALWALARIDAASSRVEVLPGMETKVKIEQRIMEKNACRAKWLLAGGLGGLFGLGFGVGLVLGLTAN